MKYERAVISMNLNMFKLAACALDNHHSHGFRSQGDLSAWAIGVMFDALDNIESATDLADNWQWE